jgi:hypothetical protein
MPASGRNREAMSRCPATQVLAETAGAPHPVETCQLPQLPSGPGPSGSPVREMPNQLIESMIARCGGMTEASSAREMPLDVEPTASPLVELQAETQARRVVAMHAVAFMQARECT